MIGPRKYDPICTQARDLEAERDHLLCRVYENANERETCGIIIDVLDEYLLAGQFGAVDRILETVDLSRLTSINIVYTFVAITRAAAHLLPHRQRVCDHVRKLVTEKSGADYADRLLKKQMG